MRHLAAIALAVLQVAAAPAAAVPLTDAEEGPATRAAFSAVPALYHLTSTVRVVSVVRPEGTTPVGRDVVQAGVAFGVAPGHLATARHLVRPSDAVLAARGPLPGVTAAEIARGDARLVTEPARVRVRPAGAAVPGLRPARAVSARVAAVSDPIADVAVLRLADVRAPFLDIQDALGTGTPVAVATVPSDGHAVAEARTGTLGDRVAVTGSGDRSLVAIDVPVERGDSGSPVLDDAGVVHGVVVRRRSGDAPALMSRVTTIRELLERTGAPAGPSPATRDVREAMAAWWRRDHRLAAERFGAAARRVPGSPFLAHMAARARELASAPYAVRADGGRRTALLALGAAALLIAGGLLAIRSRVGTTGRNA